MNILPGDLQLIESDDSFTMPKQVQSFEREKWSNYLNNSESKLTQQPNSLSKANTSKNMETTKSQNHSMYVQEIFNRLHETNIQKNQHTQESLNQRYSFTPMINRNSLKILERSKNKVKREKCDTAVEEFMSNKSFTLQKSKRMCGDKFFKEINGVIKFMSEKLDFDEFKEEFTLEETFYILTGMKYIKYNIKMEGFLQNEENLVKNMWKALADGNTIQRSMLIQFLLLLEGISNELASTVGIRREDYTLLYFNRLNYENKDRFIQKVDRSKFNPKILQKSKQLTKQYRKKKGLTTSGEQFSQTLQFYNLKQQEHQDHISRLKQTKQQQQIKQCTFKPKTLNKISLNVQSLYNKPQKKRESICLKKQQLAIEIKQNIKPVINKACTPMACMKRQMPKSFNKEVFRMRNSINDKLAKMVKTKPVIQPKLLLTVDVNDQNMINQKIVIYEGDNYQNKVEQFCSKYNLSYPKKVKLTESIREEVKKLEKKHPRIR